MKMYVGNLADEVTEDDLRKAFEDFGQVMSRLLFQSVDNLKRIEQVEILFHITCEQKMFCDCFLCFPS